VYAPLSGKIVKVNFPLADSPEYLNDEPYDEGWMVQIELSNVKEVDDLMTASQYGTYIKEEE
jgi:glycine cleavage system H protein